MIEKWYHLVMFGLIVVIASFLCHTSAMASVIVTSYICSVPRDKGGGNFFFVWHSLCDGGKRNFI